MTSALLRLPRALPHAQKAQRVEQILTELVRCRSERSCMHPAVKNNACSMIGEDHTRSAGLGIADT